MNHCWSYPRIVLVTMHSGTVSGRDPETGYIVIKPTGFRYDRLTPSDLLVMDSKGKILEGTLRPSSDTETHLYLYQHRPDIFGIVHTHSPYACIFAVLGKPIPAVMTSAALLGGEIPLGGYAAVGGEDIGSEIITQDRQVLGHHYAESWRLYNCIYRLAGNHRCGGSGRPGKNCPFRQPARQSDCIISRADRGISEYLPHAVWAKRRIRLL